MLIARLILALALLAIAAFCVFGFLATFEAPGWLMLRIVYAAVTTASLIGAAWALSARRA